MKEIVTKIALENGWEDMGPQKASYLISFLRNGQRMNFYLTTGTLTIQDASVPYDKGVTHRNVGMNEIAGIIK
jgi:hypothetical protein